MTAEEEFDLGDFQAILAEHMVTVTTAMEPLLEATEGYRVSRLAEGYSDGQARQMATDYHGALMRTVMQ